MVKVKVKTKHDFIVQLRKRGVEVRERDFNKTQLQGMLAALDTPQKRFMKVIHEFKNKKPKVLVRHLLKTAVTELKKKFVEVDDELLMPGDYMVSFNLKLDVKDYGHTIKPVTKAYTVTKPNKFLIRDLAQEFVTENYHDSAIEILETTDVKFTKAKDVALREIKARKGHPFQYKMFPDDMAINKNQGQCVLDMIMATVVKAWPMYTRQRLIEELNTVAEDKDRNFLAEGVSTRHMMAWGRFKKKVTCIALTPFMHAFESVIAPNGTDVTLTFIVNNNHVYPITDPEIKNYVSKTGTVNFKVMSFSEGCEDWSYAASESALAQQTKLVHVETDDLSPLLKEVICNTGYNPVGIMSNGPMVIAFEHPVTHQVFIASPDFLQRKEVCERSLLETNYIGFIWANQSWAQLWQAWVEFSIGPLPKSCYSEDALMIRENYPQSAYIAMTREVTEEETHKIVSYDMKQCYLSCVLENEDPFPVESVFDDIEKFDFTEKLPVGKAYVARDFSVGGQKRSKGFYPTFFVQYCLNEAVFEKADVTHVMRASRVIAGNTFKKLTEKLQEMFPVLAKRVVNSGIGAWGKRYEKTGSVAITDSFEIALGMVSEDKEIQLTEVGNNFWFLRKESKKLLYSGHVGLREHIVCMGHIKLHQMEKAVTANGGEVIAYNTDSVKVLNARFEAVPKEIAVPGDICLEGKCNLRGRIGLKSFPEYSGCDRAWTKIEPVEASIQRMGMMGVGQPGFGKSFLLEKIHTADVAAGLKSLKLAWTKTAALNIHGETLDHVFPETSTRDEWIAKGLKYDCLNLDEFTIIPEKWYSLFLQLKQLKPELKFRFFGDPQQLHSEDYDDRSSLWYRYDESHLMHRLVDSHKVQLAYLPLTARYDPDMKRKLDQFEATRTLAAFGEKRLFTPAECDFNIVKTDPMRTRINEQWVSHYSPKETVPCGKLKLWEGMYLISHKNDNLIVNSTRYLVKKIGQQITLFSDKEIVVSFEQVARSCRYGYADTVMRVISRTIHGRFNIHEASSMDWNQMFVALSRAKTAASIGIKPCDKVFEMAKPPAKNKLIKVESKLFKGDIYQKTDGHSIYTGSTEQGIEKRNKQHKDKPVSAKMAAWLAEMGDKIVTTVIETWLCMTRQQLLKRESDVTAKVPADRNMNTKNVVKAAVEKAATKLEACEITFSRFKITDDEKGRRFRIRWRDTEGLECTKDFSYRVQEKVVQQKAAEDFRAELIKEYFL